MLSLAGEERNRVKASEYLDAQKVFILNQAAAATPVAEICRKAGIIQTT